MSAARVELVPAVTHGRILVVEPSDGPPAGLLVGFHGYAEHAAHQLARLRAIPGAGRWRLVSIQALHRFYRGRSEETVASWMTQEDRETAIADNIAYVDAAVASAGGPVHPFVMLGFSQGVAMAFRAAVRGRTPSDAVIGVGGDVPPELLVDSGVHVPRVLLMRGTAEEWYTQARLDSDVAALRARGAAAETFVYPGAHEWTDAVSRRAGDELSALCGAPPP